MHMQISVNTDIEIKSLADLPKLKLLMESLKMKINKSKLARDMGVDRRTIDKYLKGYKPKSTRKRTSKVDEYYEVIKLLLSEGSIQKFYYKRVLWQYLKDNHGLDCGQSTFRKYISSKSEFQSYFKSEKRKSTVSEVVRFETPPAEQAQLDWKENIRYITKDGEILYVNVYVLLLSYSRFRTYNLSISKSQSILLSFLTESFEAFGGVPKTILTDNMKTIMDEPRTEYQKGKVNEKFFQFSKDMGFEVKPCIAGRPRTKGKVESPMKLLDEIHAYQGKFDYEELYQFVQKLCDRINNSYHQGTGKIPILAINKERNLLSPLPHERIRDSYRIDHTPVKVNPSNMVTYKSNQYSVPPGYIGKTVRLQVYDNHIFVYYNTDLIVQHPIRQSKINYKPEHYADTLARGLPSSTNIEELAMKNLEAINEVYKNE
ncbi:TPA: IS21 family transposase [Vibrio cholerae]|uniref:IS21 family transposase n=1 Tax=Sutcliffiella sp. NC1 TaxID=3004096 RepID=UPI0022DE2B09|nr:IS21 family transposase [Sutcliffiella sp. NC1]WBL13660.1 IS21 family transposase [Sutcliffiella sp. NC1]WBL14819.1 IS21 family transposase [Sutcliffiella sp. NC1]WBL17157.1 IS21 family transposase [Sutcliffiella sp. NC1]